MSHLIYILDSSNSSSITFWTNNFGSSSKIELVDEREYQKNKDVDETHQCLRKCVLELETLSAICFSAWPKSRSANLLRNAFQLCKQATDYYIHSDIFVKISFGKYPKQNKLTHLFSIKSQSKSCRKKLLLFGYLSLQKLWRFLAFSGDIKMKKCYP